MCPSQYFVRRKQKREGLNLGSLSFQEGGTGNSTSQNLADSVLFENQKMENALFVQPAGLLVLDIKMVKSCE